MTTRPSDSAQRGPASSPDPSQPDRPADPGPTSQPPGLGEQLGRTRTAALGLVAAHIDLAKAEFSEIVGEIKKAATFGSIALGMVFVAATIFTVGSILWVDEWWFGSMGWGVLHGTEIFLALGVIFALAIVAQGGGRIAGGAFLALFIAVIVTLIFGFQLTSKGLGWVGDQAFTNLLYPPYTDSHVISAADRPIAVGVYAFAAIFAVVGLVVGFVLGHGVRRIVTAILGAILGAIVGAAIGAFLGVPMSWTCAIAVGLAVWLLLWPVFAAWFVVRGLDSEKLKDRFVPDQTIETTKETIEWVRAQTPLGRKS